jgi:2-oxoglutarate dehydrogenase E2 component (dihydrolipoamide succinyltransferase)
MPMELKVPTIGESISEVEIGDWLKTKGDFVNKDEPVVTLESEKATVELPAPVSGVITEVMKKKGDTASIGEVIGIIDGERQPAFAKPAATKQSTSSDSKAIPSSGGEPRVMPAAQRAMAERGVAASQIEGTGPGGRILKEDVLRQATVPIPEQEVHDPSALRTTKAGSLGNREEEIVPMTRLRRTVAERLVAAHQNAALLTTFNEIDMTAAMALRKEYSEPFLQKYNTKLGFMSFFVKATVDALKLFPAINAEIRDNNIVYHNYFDVGVAIGGGKGLVVPVIRNTERLSFAEIEVAIANFARRAKDNKLSPDDLQGGTFTISNGGVYGSLLSTPIINPPQSGILGMHAIQERPIALNGNVVIRPMMYIALTYDHRLVDGREAVSFLKRVKEVIETPARMLLEV